ncbi:MAG: hypothetical protein GKR91_15245 [Pseudomonadales bacterium]|nr:hypothetical protein [Pseudomonadales bacterium]
MKSINGWILIYLIGSLPILAFYSAGLSGWILDYPIWLFLGLLVVFLVPLLLLILKVPSAPTWNIALLWISAGLIILRILYGILLMERGLQRPEGVTIFVIVVVALTWSILWTWYFLKSERISETFG